MSANRRRTRRGPAVVVALGLPLAGMLAGGAVGWFTRDDGDGRTAVDATGTPTGDALDAVAPVRTLPLPTDPDLLALDDVVGLAPAPTVAVPRGAAMSLATGTGGLPDVIDVATGGPAGAPATFPPSAAPVPSDSAGLPAAPESTLPPPDAADTTAAGSSAPAEFVDPCAADDAECDGAAGTLRPALSDGEAPARSLTMSVPFAVTGALAALCDTVEAGALPDPQLAPDLRPTIGVLLDQPGSVALSGTWADGSPIEKTTMRTLPAHDAAWQAALDAGGSPRILACLTLPLDTVRSHATGGRAALAVDLLAISANGRASMAGALTLAVPLDGDDAPFVDGIVLTGLGEQPQADGTLAATVHVHYSVATDALMPTGGTLDRSTARAYAQHALVERADCAGWAVNQQGVDRTAAGVFSLRTEQRTIAGKATNVTVVDGDVTLDPTVPGGWEGFLCVRLFARDDSGTVVTTVLRGAAVRAPRTALYQVGVALGTAPEGWKVDVRWSTPGGTTWCGPATLQPAASDATVPSGGTPAAQCSAYARQVAGGITVTIVPVAPDGATLPALALTLPVNTGWCNPDDEYASLGDGCDTGSVRRIDVPAGDTDLAVTIAAVRVAAPGQALSNPSHAWRIDGVQAFRF